MIFNVSPFIKFYLFCLLYKHYQSRLIGLMEHTVGIFKRIFSNAIGVSFPGLNSWEGNIDSANEWLTEHVLTWGNDDESLAQYNDLSIVCTNLIWYVIICKCDIPLVQVT